VHAGDVGAGGQHQLGVDDGNDDLVVDSSAGRRRCTPWPWRRPDEASCLCQQFGFLRVCPSACRPTPPPRTASPRTSWGSSRSTGCTDCCRCGQGAKYTAVTGIPLSPIRVTQSGELDRRQLEVDLHLGKVLLDLLHHQVEVHARTRWRRGRSRSRSNPSASPASLNSFLASSRLYAVGVRPSLPTNPLGIGDGLSLALAPPRGAWIGTVVVDGLLDRLAKR